jgi:hypothetical protein
MVAMSGDPVDHFAAACQVCPPKVFHLRVAHVRLTLRVAGSALAERLFAPFEHLREDGRDGVASDISLDAWDSQETGVTAAAGYPYEWRVPQAPARTLRCVDGVDGLKRLDLARPFQWTLIPLLAEFGLWGLHAAAIAPKDQRSGLLLVGPNGCGKSTSCMSALLAGWQMVGEDCLLLQRTEDGFTTHSLYRSFCLTEQSYRLLPTLPAPRQWPAGEPPSTKAVVIVPGSAEGGLMRRSLPVVTLVFPVIDGQASSSRWSSISPMDARRRLMPGLRLMRQLEPEHRRAHFNACAPLADALPAVRLDLGTDVQAVPQALSGLLEARCS